MKIVVCSREKVDDTLFSLSGTKALISITNVTFDESWPVITEVDLCLGVLGIRFPDKEDCPITVEEAKLIVMFAEAFKNVNYLIINCPAGLSRSAAVGSALASLYFGDKTKYISTSPIPSIPNRSVFNAVSREGRDIIQFE